MLVVPRVSDNHAPVAVDDSYTVHGCGTALAPVITANDFDPDGDSISMDAFPQLPAHGSVARGALNSVSFCPAYGYTGADSFTYELCDNHGACATGTVSVNVVNQAPEGGTDTYSVHGSAVLGPFLINDSDPDGDAVSCGDASHECILAFPAHGTLTGVAQQDKKSYAASYGYTGPDSFTYNACDGLGLCTPTTVSIDVANQAPNGSTDSYDVHGSTIVGPFLVNDSDPDGDEVTCGDVAHECILTFPEHGNVLGIVQPDKKLYGPNLGFTGSDSFTYNACDSFGLCTPTTVNINVANNAPNAVDDFYMIPGQSTTIGLFRANDSDPDGDGLSTPDIVDFPQHGSLSGLSDPDQKLYSANGGYHGTDSFAYQICDDLGKCSTAKVTLYVIGDGGNNGPAPCNLNVGAPINVSNGNMYLQQTDYQLPGVGYGISVARTYNSGDSSAAVGPPTTT
jgi:hypothetical protein